MDTGGPVPISQASFHECGGTWALSGLRNTNRVPFPAAFPRLPRLGTVGPGSGTGWDEQPEYTIPFLSGASPAPSRTPIDALTNRQG